MTRLPMANVNAEFAWPGGDRPGTLAFPYELPAAVKRVIQNSLSSCFPPVDARDVKFEALQPSDGPVGRYRMSTESESWFVRVTSRQGNSPMGKALTDFLARRGVLVNQLIVAGQTLNWEGGEYFIDVRRFIDGRHFNGSTEDLRNLAQTLAACHHALVEFPQASEIRRTAAARARRLEGIRDRVGDAVKCGRFDLFAEHAAWASEHRDWLAVMVEQFDPHLEQQSDAQCVHGEIHAGNVLFRSSDGAAVLIDFEESTHLFTPPAWDLAYLVQRFCLRDDPSPPVALERVSAIVEAYGSPMPQLAPMMRQAAWFTMATILDLRSRDGVVTPVEEYDKFVEFERQACLFAGAL